MPDNYSKVLLDESEMPTRWYNIIPDLPEPPPPPPPPPTHEPSGPDDPAPPFPMGLSLPQVSAEPYPHTPAEGPDTQNGRAHARNPLTNP